MHSIAMQLQTRYEALRYLLKIIKGCAENYSGRCKEPPNLSKFIDDELPMILKLTFNKETVDLKEALIDACRNILIGFSLSQEYFKFFIVRILESALRAGNEEGLEEDETSALHDPAQPIVDAVSKIMESLASAMKLFSRRSFEAAFLVASKLEEIEKSEESQRIRFKVREEDRVRIYPVWSLLADKRCNLLLQITDFDNTLGDLLISLKNMYEKLEKEKEEENKISALRDAIYSAVRRNDRKKLSKLVHNTLEYFKFKDVLIDYVVEHLEALGEELESAGELVVENVKKYLRMMFGESCFLEYEVYAALLEHGVPALPRLVVSVMNILGEGQKQKKTWEVDVVARVGDKLWLVEVTTSKDAEELEDKAKNLSELRDLLYAEKALIVCTKEALEISKQLPEREGVEFLSFEGLRNKLRRLLKASTRRRRPAPHQELPSLFRAEVV